MVIRKAKLKDLPQIVELAVELLNYHAKLDSFYAPSKNVKEVYHKFFRSCIFAKKRFFLVAEEQNKIIGYALGKVEERPPVFQDRNLGLINDVFVLEPFRKQGLAQSFLQELFDWFRSKGIHCVELGVHAKNEIGKKTWSKYGFEPYLSKERIDLTKIK